jgi:hypothetical protein
MDRFLTPHISRSRVEIMKKIKPSLTLADITWLKSEFLPALSESVQKGLEKKT